MTQLKPKLKPAFNKHSYLDSRKAKSHLKRLVNILDTPQQTSSPEISDIEILLKKTSVREEEI